MDHNNDETTPLIKSSVHGKAYAVNGNINSRHSNTADMDSSNDESRPLKSGERGTRNVLHADINSQHNTITQMDNHDDENTSLKSSAHDGSRNVLNSNGNPRHNTVTRYEELFKDNEPCPTCRGLGRVTREQKNELVALIPLKDERLKPRRTVWYVMLAILLSIIVAALILFFLYPRDVTVSSNQPLLTPVTLSVNKKQLCLNFTVVNTFNFTNSNYFPVEVTGAQMTSLLNKDKLLNMVTNTTSVDLPTRGMGVYDMMMNFVFDPENGLDFLVSACADARRLVHTLFFTFELTANYSYLGHIEQTTLTTFQEVDCFYNDSQNVFNVPDMYT